MIDNDIITDPTKIAEGFNNYFSTIAENLQQKIVYNNNGFMKYLNQPLDQNFIFRSVESDEILNLIDSLGENKASGPHSIPSKILKIIKPNICYPLKELINFSFATGIYPDKLKIAKVIPISKNKVDHLLVPIYRPISFL